MQSSVIFEHWEILLKWRVKIRTGKLVSNERKDVTKQEKDRIFSQRKERRRYKTWKTGFLIKERKRDKYGIEGKKGYAILNRRIKGQET